MIGQLGWRKRLWLRLLEVDSKLEQPYRFNKSLSLETLNLGLQCSRGFESINSACALKNNQPCYNNPTANRQ